MTRMVAVALAAVVAAGCGGGGGSSTAPPTRLVGGGVAAGQEYPPCPKAGDLLTEEQTRGCLRTIGDHSEVVFPGAHLCNDGRLMFAEIGVYGFIGETAKAGGAADPGFGAAYQQCVGP